VQAQAASRVEGLPEAEARRRLAQVGPNELPVSRPRGALRLLGEVASEPMFLLLVACGAIYMALGFQGVKWGFDRRRPDRKLGQSAG